VVESTVLVGGFDVTKPGNLTPPFLDIQQLFFLKQAHEFRMSSRDHAFDTPLSGGQCRK
jgi:hypothetical protein